MYLGSLCKEVSITVFKLREEVLNYKTFFKGNKYERIFDQLKIYFFIHKKKLLQVLRRSSIFIYFVPLTVYLCLCRYTLNIKVMIIIIIDFQSWLTVGATFIKLCFKASVILIFAILKNDRSIRNRIAFDGEKGGNKIESIISMLVYQFIFPQQNRIKSKGIITTHK